MKRNPQIYVAIRPSLYNKLFDQTADKCFMKPENLRIPEVLRKPFDPAVVLTGIAPGEA